MFRTIPKTVSTAIVAVLLALTVQSVSSAQSSYLIGYTRYSRDPSFSLRAQAYIPTGYYHVQSKLWVYSPAANQWRSGDAWYASLGNYYNYNTPSYVVGPVPPNFWGPNLTYQVQIQTIYRRNGTLTDLSMWTSVGYIPPTP